MNDYQEMLEAYEPHIDPEEDSSTDARREVLIHFFKRFPYATKADVIAFLRKHYPDISGGGHRGFYQREYPEGGPAETKVKVCPKCGNKAKGAKEVDSMFGFRKSGKRFIPQSWCRSCR